MAGPRIWGGRQPTVLTELVGWRSNPSEVKCECGQAVQPAVKYTNVLTELPDHQLLVEMISRHCCQWASGSLRLIKEYKHGSLGLTGINPKPEP